MRHDEDPVCLFLGGVAYQTYAPQTAVSRERLFWATQQAEYDGPRLLVGDGATWKDEPAIEVVSSGLTHGYGAVRNAEMLCDAAIEAGADVMICHDADIAFDPSDIRSLVATWAKHGPRAIVGAMYPDAQGADLVGRLTGTPKREDGREMTPRSVVDALRLQGAEAVEAESLGFGLVCIPVALMQELRATRGFVFAECWQGKAHATTPDSELCGAAKALGYMLVADLRAAPRHASRKWESR